MDDLLDATVEDNTITFEARDTNRVALYLSSYCDDFEAQQLLGIFTLAEDYSVDVEESATLTIPVRYGFENYQSSTLEYNNSSFTGTLANDVLTFTIPANKLINGIGKITIIDDVVESYDYYIYVKLNPKSVNVTITGDLIVGKKNTLTVNRDSTLLEQCTVTVYGKTYNVDWSGTDTNKIVVDLSEDNSTTPIKAVIDIAPTDKVQGKTIETSLNRSYLTVSTFNDLKTELESLTGSQYIKLAAGVSIITMTSNVNINHDVIIDCNNRILVCNVNSPYSFIVKADATFENLIARSIQPFAVQEKQSSLTLRNCTFQSYNNNISVGHIVRCNIDHSSLSEPDDFITLIDECTFKNTTLPNLIYHGGRLTITNSIFENISKQYNPLIIQVDGECIVRNCSFERTYGGTTVWGISDSKVMALFELGEDASFNGQSYNDLMDNNVLNLTNVSVLTSVPKCSFNGFTGTFTIEPIDSSKPNCLYCLSGIDYVFKANTQIRRLS